MLNEKEEKNKKKTRPRLFTEITLSRVCDSPMLGFLDYNDI